MYLRLFHTLLYNSKQRMHVNNELGSDLGFIVKTLRPDSLNCYVASILYLQIRTKYSI